MTDKNDTVVDYDNLGSALSGDANPTRKGNSTDKAYDQLSARISEKDSMIGRQSNEIGELRSQINQLSQTVNAVQQPQNQGQEFNVTPEDLIERPTETIQNILKMHDQNRDRTAEDRINQLEASLQPNTLTDRHPDYVEVSNSPDCTQWASGSPLRQSAYDSARNGDVGSAATLLDEYKANRGPDLGKVTERAHSNARDSQLTRGTEETTSGQRFKRSAIMKMRTENRDEYERLQPAILKAYSEGRVVD